MASAGESKCAPRRDWRAILCDGGPRAVLARLLSGDPLGLAAAVERRLRQRAYLFDADRVVLRTAARCARLALRYRGEPAIEDWIVERVDEALLDLLRSDAEDERAGRAPAPDKLVALETLARPLGLDPGRMYHLCVRHNQLPEAQRRAFRDLVLDARPLDAWAQREGLPARALAQAARAALDALLECAQASEDPCSGGDS